MIEKIKALKNKGLPLEEIENLLLTEELGKIETWPNGYQYIENFALSWLIVEVHKPRFIEWMGAHSKKFVVHHRDGNPTNNLRSNLRIMSRSIHLSLHRNDPRFAEVEKARNEKHLDWYKDSSNAETEKARGKKISAYYKGPANAEIIETRSKKHSEILRKNNGWITSESNTEFFKSPFTVREYAVASEISLNTAQDRLASLFRSKEVTSEKRLISGKQCNVFRKSEELNSYY